jgi:hypothetical protein
MDFSDLERFVSPVPSFTFFRKCNVWIIISSKVTRLCSIVVAVLGIAVNRTARKLVL